MIPIPFRIAVVELGMLTLSICFWIYSLISFLLFIGPPSAEDDIIADIGIVFASALLFFLWLSIVFLLKGALVYDIYDSDSFLICPIQQEGIVSSVLDTIPYGRNIFWWFAWIKSEIPANLPSDLTPLKLFFLSSLVSVLTQNISNIYRLIININWGKPFRLNLDGHSNRLHYWVDLIGFISAILGILGFYLEHLWSSN